MAVKIAAADGNLNTAGTWGTVDATAFLDSEANNTALTTSYVESAGFTPGAITVDGIAVKVATRAASPTGTISVRIAQAGATVAGTEVTINVSDIPSRDGEQGWIFFKFAAPVALLAATVYTVSAKTSSASQVNLYRNATAGNWSRMLRTTTTGAPGAGDSFHILGEWTAAATKTNRAVTMDNTAATDFGDGSTSNPGGITIGIGGTLTWGVTAATNYRLKVSTQLIINYGGTMTMGGVGTEMPRNSTALLDFDSAAADGDFGMVCFGTLTVQGLSRTSGLNVVQAKLNTDEAAASVLIGLDTDTGWLNGDDVAIAATSRTFSETETKALTANAGASSAAIAALASAHSGTAPTQAEVILLTRNVRIESSSSTFMAYVRFGNASTVDLDWMSFRYMGSTTTNKRGVEVQTTSAGSFNMAYCSLRDFDSHGLYITGSAVDNFTVSHTVGYKVGSQTSGHSAIGVKTATTGTNWSITYCTILGNNAGGGYGFEFQDVGGVATNLRAAGNGGSSGAGLYINEPAGKMGAGWTTFELHSNNNCNLKVLGVGFLTMASVNLWRSTSHGCEITEYGEMVFNSGLWFGNGTANLAFLGGTFLTGSFIGRTLTLAGDSSFSTGSGLALPNANNRGFPMLRFENCTFGSASGIYVAHATQDITFGTGATRYAALVLNNCLLASSTELANESSLYGRSYIAYERVDQATGVHKTVYQNLGTVARDTVTYRTASPSEKLTPSGALPGCRLRSGVRRKPIASGQTATISAYVRKDSSYAGSTVRLVQLANPAIGVLTDTVIASMTGGANAWEELSGTTAAASEDGVVEFVVEVDGSAGNVYTDDWS